MNSLEGPLRLRCLCPSHHHGCRCRLTSSSAACRAAGLSRLVLALMAVWQAAVLHMLCRSRCAQLGSSQVHCGNVKDGAVLRQASAEKVPGDAHVQRGLVAEHWLVLKRCAAGQRQRVASSHILLKASLSPGPHLLLELHHAHLRSALALQPQASADLAAT